MTAVFQDAMFHNEDAAREALEVVRWPHGPVCPHCNASDQAMIAKVGGTKHRAGLYYCNECKSTFTVTVGTVFERSKVPLTKWWIATRMFNSGKNGVSAHEIHRTLGVTYKTAWFMMHRLREAMIDLGGEPMGGEGQSVQIDETYTGNTSKRAKGYKKNLKAKRAIVALVDKSKGRVRAFHVKNVNAKTVRAILVKYASRKSTLVTDEALIYRKVGREFSGHKRVFHKHGWYVTDDGFTTNNVENFFGQFKKSLRGTYQFCSEQHLQRYLNEFSFRYSHRAKLGFTDGERTVLALKGIEGKRLTYRPTGQDQDQEQDAVR
jgi:transposase-like protein